ncbi:MAG: hypothetical protein Q8K75_11590 [Chlamydiales bacterium]|nr:hypothetical protein [Chlamydiales bacterium]
MFKIPATLDYADVQEFFQRSHCNRKPDLWHKTFMELSFLIDDTVWNVIDECILRLFMNPYNQKYRPHPPWINAALVDRFVQYDPERRVLPFLFGSTPSEIWEEEIARWPQGRPPHAFILMVEHLLGCKKGLRVPSCMVANQIRCLIEVGELARRVGCDYFIRECGQKFSLLLAEAGGPFKINAPIEERRVRDFFATCPDLLERLLVLNFSECETQLLMLQDSSLRDAAVVETLRNSEDIFKENLEFGARFAKGLPSGVPKGVDPLRMLLYLVYMNNTPEPLVRDLIEKILDGKYDLEAYACLQGLVSVNEQVRKVFAECYKPLSPNVSCDPISYTCYFEDAKRSDDEAKALVRILETPWLTSMRDSRPKEIIARLQFVRRHSRFLWKEICRTLAYVITPTNLMPILRLFQEHAQQYDSNVLVDLYPRLSDAALERWPGLQYNVSDLYAGYRIVGETFVDDELWEFLAHVVRYITIEDGKHLDDMIRWSGEKDVAKVIIAHFWTVIVSGYQGDIEFVDRGNNHIEVKIKRDIFESSLECLKRETKRLESLGWGIIWKDNREQEKERRR